MRIGKMNISFPGIGKLCFYFLETGTWASPYTLEVLSNDIANANSLYTCLKKTTKSQESYNSTSYDGLLDLFFIITSSNEFF